MFKRVTLDRVRNRKSKWEQGVIDDAKKRKKRTDFLFDNKLSY